MQYQPIVIDTGEYLMKVGYADDLMPSVIFRNLIGQPISQDLILGVDQKSLFIGEEIQGKEDYLQILPVIENQKILNQEILTKVWEYSLDRELQADYQKHPILMSIHPGQDMNFKNRIFETFFEDFKVDSFYPYAASSLVLFSLGRTTGLVVESGYSQSYSIPVFEGYSIPFGYRQIPFGGKQLLEILIDFFKQENEINLSQQKQQDFFQQLKEEKCFVSMNFDSQLKSYEHNENTNTQEQIFLPDGKELKVSSQLFRATESLFQPSKNGLQILALQEIAYQSILKCNQEIKNEIYQNVVLSGGNSLF